MCNIFHLPLELRGKGTVSLRGRTLTTNQRPSAANILYADTCKCSNAGSNEIDLTEIILCAGSEEGAEYVDGRERSYMDEAPGASFRPWKRLDTIIKVQDRQNSSQLCRDVHSFAQFVPATNPSH